MENYLNKALLAKALNECANEPIQFPKSIQEYGILLVMDTNYKIVKVSGNIESFLGIKLQSILNQNLNNFFKLPESFGEYYLPKTNDKYIEEEGRYFQSINKYDLFFIPTQKYLQGLLTFVDNYFVLELEEYSNEEELSIAVVCKEVLLSINRNNDNFKKMLTSILKKIQNITGSDRIKVYKFASDWSGEVIAEVKVDTMPSYLGLHFPASDIPIQARELYSKNWIRIIPDVDYQAVPIIGNEIDFPLDLSYVSLRSVSPVHIQYLKNMGVKASFSISIIVNNKLWGLIVGHHLEALYLDIEKRSICEFIGQTLSIQIAAYEKRNLESSRERKITGFEIITSKIFENSDLFGELKKSAEHLIELVNAHSLWIVWNEKEVFVGDIPNGDEDKQKLLNYLKNYFSENNTLFNSNELYKLLPLKPSFLEKAGGVLAISIPTINNSYLIWFKKEKIATVNWAGKPFKKIIIEDDKTKLLPRNSFEKWKETVKRESDPWTLQDIEGIITVRNAIMANLLLKAEKERKSKQQLEKLIVSLQESNEELKNFAYVTSHDLQEPLRQVFAFAQLMERRIKSKLDSKEEEYLQFIMEGTKNMQTLIDDLLEYSRITSQIHEYSEVDFNQILKNALNTLSVTIRRTKAKIKVVTLPTLKAKGILVQQVFQNLLSNALKYQNTDNTPEISIGYEEKEAYCKFWVKDNGIGIKNEFKESIFLLFRRLHTKKEYTGNGMGLTLCRKIIKQHGGTIWVESKLGKESCFYFTISKEL